MSNVSCLPPGTYIITAAASPPRTDKKDANTNDSATRADFEEERMVHRQVEVTIAEEDRRNVSIELSQGSRILGNVVVEGSEPVSISITVDAKEGKDLLMSFPRHTNVDGTFMVEGVSSGEVIIDALVTGVDDLYLKSITLGSQDLLREPLRMTEGAEVTGVRITLGKGLATLTGRAQLKENGSPAAGGGVLLVSADPKLWHLVNLRVFTTTNASGEFTLKCAPGDYLVFTWAAGGQPLRSVEDFVRSQRAAARTISLQSKEEKQIELTIVSTRK